MKTHIGHDMGIQPGLNDEALVNLKENMCRDSDTLRAPGCLAATMLCEVIWLIYCVKPPMFDSPANSCNLHGLVVTHIYKFISANVSKYPGSHTLKPHWKASWSKPFRWISWVTTQWRQKLLQPAVNVNVTLYEDSALIVPGVEISQASTQSCGLI